MALASTCTTADSSPRSTCHVGGVALEPRATDDSRGNVAFIELGNDMDIGLAGGEADVRTWRIDDGKVSEAELVVQ